MNSTTMAPLEIDSSVRHIVVINTAFLGDLVLTIPFLTNLKRKYPKAEISLVCKHGIGELFLKLDLVSKVFEVKKSSRKNYGLVADEINKNSPEIVFCIHRSFRSYLFSMKIKAPLRFGYQLGFNWYGFQKKIKRDLSLPESLRILQLLTLVDESFAIFFKVESQRQDYNSKKDNENMVPVPSWAQFPTVALPKLSGNINDRLFEKIKETATCSKHVAVFPGSVWNTKRWPEEYFANLVMELKKSDYAVFLMGGPGEEVYAEAIEKKTGKSETVINLIGKTSVWESILIMNHVDLVVANDSASAHLAALLRKKILVFFGPTVLNFGYRPWGDTVRVLENTELKCRPCGAHGPNQCPIKTHECMRSIPVGNAMNSVRALLA